MTTQDANRTDRPDPADEQDPSEAGAIAHLDPRTTLIDYSGLNFKEFLAACPIDGIDLTREPEYPREVEL